MNLTKPRNVKKYVATGVAAVALVSAVGSFALFTDRAQSHAEMTAGTLDLTLTQSWVSDNAEIADEYGPGDILKLDYTLENTGSLSTDIRETFVITGDKVVDGNFDIYAFEDVEQNAATHLWAPKSGAQPISVRSTDSYTADKDGNGTVETYYTISYDIPELTVDGTDETGDATSSTAGSTIAGDTKTGEYVLLFNKDAENGVQGTNLTLEYIAQGLQHRNTGDNTWTDAKVITESLTIGGEKINVMPENN